MCYITNIRFDSYQHWYNGGLVAVDISIWLAFGGGGLTRKKQSGSFMVLSVVSHDQT